MKRFMGTFFAADPVGDWTKDERERVADVLSTIAADIKKGATAMACATQFTVRIDMPEVSE